MHRGFDAISASASYAEPPPLPPFPVRERVIKERSSIFKGGACFSNYVGYVRKACHYLDHPLSWDTAAVKNAVAALKLQGSGNFRFPNFIRSEFVARIAAKETRDGPFAQLSFISFLYALRVPSEALVLRRSFWDDDLTGFAPIRDRALIGVRGSPGQECLVIRFGRRKKPTERLYSPPPILLQAYGPIGKTSLPDSCVLAGHSFQGEMRGASFPGVYNAECQYRNQSCFSKAGGPSRRTLHVPRL